MPIAGVLVIAINKDLEPQLAERLGSESGIEVGGIGPAGIAIVVETETMKAMTSLTSQIKQWQDVVDLQMTYCNWEDLD